MPKQALRRFVFLSYLLGALCVRAELPDGVVFDDGYTWFSVMSHEEPVEGKATDRGWSLQYTLRFLGDIPAFSAVRTVVSKDGKELANVRMTQAQGEAPFELVQGESFSVRKLYDADDLIVGDGVYDVALYYIDGNTDKEYPVREYQLDVRKVHRQHHLKFINPPHYYVNHHGNIKDTFISQRRKDERTYLPGHAGLSAGDATHGVGGDQRMPGIAQGNWISLVFYLPRDDNPSPGDAMLGGGSRLAGSAGYVTATVNGEALDLTHPELKFLDSAFVTLRNTEKVIHTDRYAKQYHAGTEYREPIGFARYVMNVPITWGPPEERIPLKFDQTGRATETTVALDEHPGNWQLDWVINGEVMRTWRFTVGEDGLIEPHPDEAKSGLTFAPRTHLVEMEIPEGGSRLDDRLTPEFIKDFAFYGLGLPKSLIKGVPTKGKPFPEFSGPREEPIDLAEEDRKRRQEVKDRVAAEQAAKKAEREAEEAERQAQLAADREQAAAEDAQRQAEHEARQAEIAALVESEKAKAMAEVERLTEGYSEAAEELAEDGEREARYRGGLPFWIRILLSLSLIGGGVVLAGQFIKEKAEPAKAVVDALQPMATLFGWALLALAVISLLLDLVYLRPLIANGLPQILALAGGLVLARGAIKEKLATVGGGAAEQAAKAKEALEKQEARFALLDDNAVAIGLGAIVVGLLHLIIGASAIF